MVDRQRGIAWLLRVWVMGWCIYTSLGPWLKLGLPTRLSISSSSGQLTKLLRSTKQFKKINSNLKPGIKGLDRYRTTIANNDFASINSSSSGHSVFFTSADVNKRKLLDCQVVLHDVLCTSFRRWISTWLKPTVLILVKLWTVITWTTYFRRTLLLGRKWVITTVGNN